MPGRRSGGRKPNRSASRLKSLWSKSSWHSIHMESTSFRLQSAPLVESRFFMALYVDSSGPLYHSQPSVFRSVGMLNEVTWMWSAVDLAWDLILCP